MSCQREVDYNKMYRPQDRNGRIVANIVDNGYWRCGPGVDVFAQEFVKGHDNLIPIPAVQGVMFDEAFKAMLAGKRIKQNGRWYGIHKGDSLMREDFGDVALGEAVVLTRRMLTDLWIVEPECPTCLRPYDEKSGARDE
jgi:hypothetical protein